MHTFKTSKAKENILRKIRLALNEDTLPFPFPEVEKQSMDRLFMQAPDQSIEELFAEQFTRSGGHFIFCDTQMELLENIRVLSESRNWSEILCAHKPLFSFLVNNKLSIVREFNPAHESAEVCITDCEVAVAETGSFLFSSRQNHGRVAPVYFPVHIVVVQPHQIVQGIADALKLMKQKYNHQLPSMMSLNTGPSRTADIEKTLVTGVHGPKELFCFFLNQ